ncbi:MAG: Xaa-Pro peptidase family protein [bacterium]
MFSAKFYKQNRSNVSKTTDVDIIVLTANGLVQKSADTTFKFKQDSNFWYLTGLDLSEATVVINKQTNTEYLIMPPRLDHRDMWEGKIDESEVITNSGIKTVYAHDAGWDVLKKDITSNAKVGTILPARSYEPNYGMYINPAKLVFSKKIKRLAGKNIVDIRRNLAVLRQVKTAEEISYIKSAVNITADGLFELRKNIKNMNSENDINIFLTHEFALKGANGHAYNPIIASGKNAATIHYEKNDSPLSHGSLLLMDVGAQYGHYAADISRTWSLGLPSKRQQQVFDAVYNVRQYALNLLKPGVILREYEKDVRTFMNTQLNNLGLIGKNKSEDQIKYYPHLTSHFLGIDVHDAGDYDTPLVANTVLTVEPGIYIPEENIGIRIEDDVLITPNGFNNLSDSIPTHLV